MDARKSVPDNVLWFEVLLYLSLVIDTLSVAFLDEVPDDMTESMLHAAQLATACLIAFFIYLVWLAARRRQNWARWVLAGSLGFSLVMLAQTIGETGLAFRTWVEILSCALTAAGLYFSFTGNARDWFDGSAPD